MKKIIFMALFAATLSACSNENNEVTQETTNLKSLDFSFDVATPKTRMSDDEVTTAITAVRSNIQNITIEYFNASNASLGTYDFTPEQVTTAKGDDQTAAAAGRKPVNISNIPSATTKVNVYMNVDKSAANINDLQIGYTKRYHIENTMRGKNRRQYKRPLQCRGFSSACIVTFRVSWQGIRH